MVCSSMSRKSFPSSVIQVAAVPVVTAGKSVALRPTSL